MDEVFDDGSSVDFDAYGNFVSSTSPSGTVSPADTSILAGLGGAVSDFATTGLGTLARRLASRGDSPSGSQPGAPGNPTTAAAQLSAAQRRQMLMIAGGAIAVALFVKLVLKS